MKTKYPPNCWTVQRAIKKIEKTFSHPELRVERFTFEVVTSHGHTLKLKWDRHTAAQPGSIKLAD